MPGKTTAIVKAKKKKTTAKKAAAKPLQPFMKQACEDL